MDKPCLFQYATSELSQDAFFAYLLAWADDKHKDSPEHALGRQFLQKMFELNGKRMPERVSVKVYRQCDHMDIFCEINDKDFALIFEDKVSALEHGTQLSRYWETTKGYGYSDESILGIYCKTHESSQGPSDSRYHVVNRRIILDLLGGTDGQSACGANSIISDFKTHLEQIDKLTKGYETKPLGEHDWDGLAWTGFFSAIEKELKDGAWNYVPNAAGGFMGFWWHWINVDGGNLYLQLEEGKACFKVEVAEFEKVQELKFGWNERLVASGDRISRDGVCVVCPNRMRAGGYMTVAILKDDYRVWDGDRLDFKKTVEKLRAMETILDEAVKHDQTTQA